MPPPLPRKSYYEGTLQLRDIDENVHHWVHERTRLDDKATITGEIPVTGGVDLRFSDMHYLQAIGKKLKEKFRGQLIVSKRLFAQSRETSKILYRVTVLFRQLPYNIGDTIEFRGNQYVILHIGNRVRVKDKTSGVKKEYAINDLEHARVLAK